MIFQKVHRFCRLGPGDFQVRPVGAVGGFRGVKAQVVTVGILVFRPEHNAVVCRRPGDPLPGQLRQVPLHPARIVVGHDDKAFRRRLHVAAVRKMALKHILLLIFFTAFLSIIFIILFL